MADEDVSNLPSTSKKQPIVGNRCVVWGCGTLSAEGHGMFFWPKNAKLASAWTKRVQNTRSDFKGPGYPGSKNPTICGKHFETTCFTKSCLLKKEMGFKTSLKLLEDAIPSVFPKPALKRMSHNVETSTLFPTVSPKKYKLKSGGAFDKRERKRVIADLMNSVATCRDDIQVADVIEPAMVVRNEDNETLSSVISDMTDLMNSQNLYVMPLTACKEDVQVADVIESAMAVSIHDNGTFSSVGMQTDSITQEPNKVHVRSKGVQIRIHFGKTVGTQTPSPVMCDRGSQCECEHIVTVDTGSQCEIIGDSELDSQDSLPEHDDPKDVDWIPDASDRYDDDASETDTDEETEIPDINEKRGPLSGTKVLVYLSCLLSLFITCQSCLEKTPGYVRRMIGSYIEIHQACRKCGFVRKWCSQPFIRRYPAGNLAVSAAILFAGSSCSKAMQIFQILNLKSITARTYLNHQRQYLQPAIYNIWKSCQLQLIDGIKGVDTPLITGGDGRCDSPGHCAKYGCYTIQDLKQNKILDIQLVQSNEVKSSFHMEMAGLIRCLSFLEEAGLNVAALVTDRHVQVAKWMRENRPFIDHRYDVWHVGKNIKKKLEKLAKEKQCEEIAGWIQSIINHLYWSASSTDDGAGDLILAKWLSVLNHVQNRHAGHGTLFPECTHGELDPAVTRKKKWIKAESIPALKLERVVARTTLLRDVKKLSHHYQTYGLEVYHSLVNQFAPKMYAYSFAGQYTRLLLAAMHFNENSDREQARTSSGDLVYSLKFPKAKRGGYVVRTHKTNPTFDYVQQLLTEVEHLSTTNTRIQISDNIAIPPPLSSGFEKPDKNEAAKQLVSRFQK